MNKKAQVIIEFMLILFILMVYISEVLLPAADTVTNSLFDTSNLSKIDIQTQRLDKTVKQMNYHIDSEYHMLFNIPNDTNFFCTQDGNIAYTVKFSSQENPQPCLTTGQTPTNPTENCCYFYNNSLHCSKKILNPYIWNCQQTNKLLLKGPFSGTLVLKTLSSNDVNIIIQEGD